MTLPPVEDVATTVGQVYLRGDWYYYSIIQQANRASVAHARDLLVKKANRDCAYCEYMLVNIDTTDWKVILSCTDVMSIRVFFDQQPAFVAFPRMALLVHHDKHGWMYTYAARDKKEHWRDEWYSRNFMKPLYKEDPDNIDFDLE